MEGDRTGYKNCPPCSWGLPMSECYLEFGCIYNVFATQQLPLMVQTELVFGYSIDLG